MASSRRRRRGGLDFGVSMVAGPNEGLDALNLEFQGFYDQFENVTIPVGQQFSFVFASIAFDPSQATVLHPFFGFQINQSDGTIFAMIPSTIMVGPESEFGPLSFAPGRFATEPIPEPATFLMLVSVGAAAGLARARRVLKVSRVR